MEIRIFLSAFLLFFSFNLFSNEGGIPKCEDIGIEVKSTFIDYQFDRKTTKLISKDLALGPLEPQWSNETREMKEVFYQFKKESEKADSVEISYQRESDKKILDIKSYSLGDEKDGLLKVKGFLFEKGVQKPEDRPGIQKYIFKKNRKPLCQQIVKHYYASEAQ